MVKRVILSLGGNIGDREAYLSRATHFINERIGEIVKQTPVVETEAWGFNAAPFLNRLLYVKTSLNPFELLEQTQIIEKDLGRTKKTSYLNGKAQYTDRTIDIDILFYEDAIIQTPNLTIPHPQIYNREFIMNLLTDEI